jgi:hypothetical protein
LPPINARRSCGRTDTRINRGFFKIRWSLANMILKETPIDFGPLFVQGPFQAVFERKIHGSTGFEF